MSKKKSELKHLTRKEISFFDSAEVLEGQTSTDKFFLNNIIRNLGDDIGVIWVSGESSVEEIKTGYWVFVDRTLTPTPNSIVVYFRDGKRHIQRGGEGKVVVGHLSVSLLFYIGDQFNV